ncbi:MAG TPA: SIS domain-containing protein, partial [Pirellulaceae bacterium]|nr:SIS domain-containing protein [Pirellulaceae bacterium]
MSTAPLMPLDGDSLSSFEQYRLAREILRVEGQALTTLADRLDKVAFCDAVEIIFKTPGNVIVSGMGKAGLIGQKLVATLASTGTRAHYLHPAEAVHGDLGRVRSDDTVIVLSYGGETAEVSRILPTLELFGVPLIAITGKPQSTLGRAATVTL